MAQGQGRSIAVEWITGERVTARPHRDGVYRVTLSYERFGQITKQQANAWMAEIREAETGNLLRYAGIWETLREAVRECVELERSR